MAASGQASTAAGRAGRKPEARAGLNYAREYEMGDLFIRHAVNGHPEDRYFFMHIHERCEIFCFVSGEAEYLVEGARYPLEPGSLVLMSPLESHRTRILESRPYERFALNFSVSAVESIDPQRLLLKPFFDRPPGRGNLYGPSELSGVCPVSSLREICEEKMDDYERRIRLLTYLLFLMERLRDAYTRRGAADYRPPESLAEHIAAYINSHLFEELSVPMLAERFSLSVSQFGKIFRNAAGAAPWEYVTAKRLNAAREKMRGGASAREAGESCGFGDYSAFYRAYVKYFGCAPKCDIQR